VLRRQPGAAHDGEERLTNAFDNAAAQTPTGDITGINLAGQALGAGVYSSAGSILISGAVPLTLNGGGDADSVFIFQAAAAGDLTVVGNSRVEYTNGAQPCNVFWNVQSALLSNTGFGFVGTILALTQITLTSNITVEGRLLARNANVTLIQDTIVRPSTCVQQADVDAAAAAAARRAAEAAAAEAARVEAARVEAARVEAARVEAAATRIEAAAARAIRSSLPGPKRPSAKR
jgi:type VI secretion system secreted protein VgrG